MKEKEEAVYAVIRTAGKQYVVRPGERIRIARRAEEPGTVVSFDEVLAIKTEAKGFSLGAPLVSGAAVSGKILRHDRGKKVIVFKKKKRKGHLKKQGHRQDFTEIQIEGIRG